ncbi:MAG: hypothetical protein ABR595_08840 [Psychroflexus sp.]
MDAAAQIKNDLISRIKDSEDLEFLKALQTLFDTSTQNLYELSPEQEESISTGRTQIKKAEFSSHESLIFEKREWLTKK